MVFVYTVLAGNYDCLRKPPNLHGVRFVCITDKKTQIPDDNGWEILRLDRQKLSKKDFNRYHKILGYKRFPQRSIYVDANITIGIDLYKLIDLTSNKAMCIFKHPCRNNLEDEFKKCKKLGLINPIEVIRFKSIYNKLSSSQGELGENNIIFRDARLLDNHLMEEWWQLYQNICKRDQLTLPFLSRKIGIEYLDRTCFPFLIGHHQPSISKKLKNIFRRSVNYIINA